MILGLCAHFNINGDFGVHDMIVRNIEKEIENIVKEYLFNITSLYNHNHFVKRKIDGARAKYYKDTGFGLFSEENENAFVVKEELFLEGCTRVFLINPIIKVLLDIHEIENEWRFGVTFANHTVSNREYEMGNFIEFIALLDGKKVGVRYTKASYSDEETILLDRDHKFLFNGAKIVGFDNLSPIDEMLVLCWQDIEEEKLVQIHPAIPGVSDISVRKFFDLYFSKYEYDLVINTAKNAYKMAKEIIALRAVPQLLPNNILNYKNVVLEEFDKKRMVNLVYKFKKTSISSPLSEEDLLIISNNFFANGYRNALIGNGDFAKSFITAEYLYKIIKDGLSIDYTAVVVGYLKSVEQLLYLLYISAFEGLPKLEYWDRCKDFDNFDDTNKDKFRYDPYNKSDKKWKQKKDFHKKKIGKKAPEIGELNRFLRYYEKMWAISETGKEYVFECLEDFREYCRNSHFHKDNIGSFQYDEVKKIRNNTHVCLYYLLGGFKLLDKTSTAEEQLGIINYRFETFYQEIRQQRKKYFEVKLPDGTEDIICYLNNDSNIIFNENGMLNDAILRFVKTGMTVNTVYYDEINLLLQDEDYINNNTICITRNNMPEKMIAVMPKKK